MLKYYYLSYSVVDVLLHVTNEDTHDLLGLSPVLEGAGQRVVLGIFNNGMPSCLATLY